MFQKTNGIIIFAILMYRYSRLTLLGNIHYEYISAFCKDIRE